MGFTSYGDSAGEWRAVMDDANVANARDAHDVADWGDGLGDGHHPHLCGPQCPCKQQD